LIYVKDKVACCNCNCSVNCMWLCRWLDTSDIFAVRCKVSSVAVTVQLLHHPLHLMYITCRINNCCLQPASTQRAFTPTVSLEFWFTQVRMCCPSVLRHCLLGDRKGIRPVNTLLQQSSEVFIWILMGIWPSLEWSREKLACWKNTPKIA